MVEIGHGGHRVGRADHFVDESEGHDGIRLVEQSALDAYDLYRTTNTLHCPTGLGVDDQFHAVGLY